LVDNMNALGTKTGGSAALNEHNYLFGSGGAIQAIFTDAGVTLSDTLSATIDISDYLKGIVLLPTYIPTADKFSSIVVRLISSSGNYYQVTTTADSIADFLIDGWNLIRFNLANRTTTGSPVATAITSWEIIGTTTTGETETWIFDSFTVQKTNPFNFDYYSNKPFVSSLGVLWQSAIEYTTDSVNIDRDVRGILHYELCLLVVQSATFDKIDSQASKRFERQLQRKYEAYWAVHPSAELPHSYSKSPEIDINIDRDVDDL